jgi:hypothetical protein
MIFDFQDDAEDRQRAEIGEIRSRGYLQSINSGIVTQRVIREKMLQDGDIDQSQFDRLELDDGRLPDGTNVLALFYSKDTKMKKLLNLGLPAGSDPLDVEANNEDEVLEAIKEKTAECNEIMVNATNHNERWRAYQALVALEKLQKAYEKPEETPAGIDQEPEEDQDKIPVSNAGGEAVRVLKPETETDPRNRATDKVNPNQAQAMNPNPEDDGTEAKEGGKGQPPFCVIGGHIEVLVVKTKGGYRNALRSLARGYWSNELNYFSFYEGMMQAINAGFTWAWNEGFAEMGIPPEEFTDEERVRLRTEIYNESQYIEGLSILIEQNGKIGGGKLAPVLTRVEGWLKNYDHIKTLAMTYGRGDPKMEWVVDAPKESCSDCQKLKGKVKRASYWREHVIPKDWKLECKNGCLCELKPTDQPMSKGPLPALSGA